MDNQLTVLSLELQSRIQMNKEAMMGIGVHSYPFTSLELTINYLSLETNSFQYFFISATMNPFKNSAFFLKTKIKLSYFLHLILKVKINTVLLGLLTITKAAGGTNHSLSPQIMAKLNPAVYKHSFYAIGEKLGIRQHSVWRRTSAGARYGSKRSRKFL